MEPTDVCALGDQWSKTVPLPHHISQSHMSNPPDQPVAVITGGSAGLGLVIAEAMIRDGYRVAIVGRDRQRLDAATQQLQMLAVSSGLAAESFAGTEQADVTSNADVTRLFTSLNQRLGRLDVLVNCVGTSDRGLAEHLTPERLSTLFEQNVLCTLRCSQAALPMLRESRGVIVNIGSLAAKVGARYLGGYPAAKHALAGLTQQMRLENQADGVHVALVNPGPIRRADAGTRYQASVDARLPPEASAPGGGTRVKGLPPQRVAQAVIRCIRKRQPDLVVPGHLRLLIAIGHAFPTLGDWLLLKFTSSKRE